MKSFLNASIMIVLLSLGMMNLAFNPFNALSRASEGCPGDPPCPECTCCEECGCWLCDGGECDE